MDELLAAEPGNAEYVDVRESLVEVIALTEDLIASATTNQRSTDGTPPEASDAPAPPSAYASGSPGTMAAGGSVAGAACQALYDGVWYEASIDAINPDGKIRVTFTGYGTVADVDPDDVRGSVVGGGEGGGEERGAGAEGTEVYKGVPAPKRLKASDKTTFVPREMPKKLMILDGDDEATRERKRKQIKAFKGKQRAQEMDAEQNAKKSSWQTFQAKVGGKKKTGFMTKKIGTKKESMFSVSGTGKVGVVGSGQGTTEYAQRKRYEFNGN